jgi:hypothetical protein
MNELERQLVELGAALAVPEPSDLVPRVLDRVGDRRPDRHRRRRLVLALAVVAFASVLAALAIPDARSALLRVLRIGGARIELVDELPAVAPTPPELELGPTLGERVSLDEARRRAGFDLLELADAPDAVYVDGRDTVWFLYGQPTAVRLLVAQSPRVEVDEAFVLKKLAAAGTSVEALSVRGAPAYFLSGEPHLVLLVDEDGVARSERARLARDVLLWEEGGRTVRLEGDLSRKQALQIADDLR